jgi:hypothetical protein
MDDSRRKKNTDQTSPVAVLTRAKGTVPERRTSRRKVPDQTLTEDRLAKSVRLLLQLAVERNRTKLPKADTDADIFSLLFQMVNTDQALLRVIKTLETQEQRRSAKVLKARLANFAYRLLKFLDTASAGPHDDVKNVQDLAHWCGIPITKQRAVEVIELARRRRPMRRPPLSSGKPKKHDERRVARICTFITEEKGTAKTVRTKVELLKTANKLGSSEADSAKATKRKGKYKTADALAIYRHEQESGTEILEYVLRVIASDVPWAAEAALSAWSEALRRTLRIPTRRRMTK